MRSLLAFFGFHLPSFLVKIAVWWSIKPDSIKR
jgi:hypothetical protein